MERTDRVLLRSSHAVSAIEQLNPTDSWRDSPSHQQSGTLSRNRLREDHRTFPPKAT